MLTINREFVEYSYRYTVVRLCVSHKIATIYGISLSEAIDILPFLATKELFSDSVLSSIILDDNHLDEKKLPSMEYLENCITEWKESRQSGETLPFIGYKVNLINALSMMLGVHLYVEKEPEQLILTRHALGDTPEKAGLLTVMPYLIMTFYYVILAWWEKKLYRSKWLYAYETLKEGRKHLKRISWFFSLFEKANNVTPPKLIDQLEHYYNKDYRTVGIGRYIQLFYGRGYFFDETISRERDLAFQWLQSVYQYTKSYEEIIDDIELMLFKSQEAKIEDPYYAKQREIVDAHLWSCETKWLSERLDDEVNEKSAQGDDSENSSKKGEKHVSGTWHTDNNTTSDLVWTERFSKCWKKLKSLIIEKIVFPNKFNTGRKKERAISMLEASMLYKVLESNGLARSFWEHGTTSSFVKTLPQEADIYRQGLGSYIFLIEIIQRIEELKQENSFYKDTKRTTSGTGLKGGGDKVNWKRGKQEQLLLTQNPKDLIMELKLNYPDIADFLTVKFENHESILSIMNEISNYSWCKNPSR